jgi:DNA-formamidopyrimidine glycosylase
MVGETLRAVELPRRWAEQAPALVGQRIVAARSHGKHLLLTLSGGLTLHCHAMLFGSWQIGERPLTLRKEPARVRVRLATDRHEAVFFNGPVVELLDGAALSRHRSLPHLGPDVLEPALDRAALTARVVAEGERPIGDVVLDQTIVSGIGNIYKSEGLFLAGLDPRRPASSIGAAELGRFLDLLVPIMQAAARPGGRMIRLPAELEARGHRRWVYRRRGQPCLTCGAPIELVRQGQLGRTSYFCPRCQPLNPGVGARPVGVPGQGARGQPVGPSPTPVARWSAES